MSDLSTPILEVKELHIVHRGSRGGKVHAVRGVSLQLQAGEALGIVGESGCGKSSLGEAIMHLVEPSEGQILFQGNDVWGKNTKELAEYRRQVQMVFQDTSGALNPRMTVLQILVEVLSKHDGERPRWGRDVLAKRHKRVAGYMKQVGLAEELLARYPHELSGGQRQRVGIARALAVGARVLVADEPVSALDVSVQAQVLALLQELRNDLGLAYLFISHDLSVVHYLCERVVVLYAGQVMEMGTTAEVLRSPRHPYTQMLLQSLPDVEQGLKRRQNKPAKSSGAGEDEAVVIAHSKSGCPFAPRCKHAQDICAEKTPSLESSNGLSLACHFPLGGCEL